jgi:hypothetical protein
MSQPIRCDHCGFETEDGTYDVYEGVQIIEGKRVSVRLKGEQPYRLGAAHVCDRFEFGIFRAVSPNA